MLDLKEHENKYKELIDKLPSHGCSFSDADSLAVEFLKASYDINNELRRVRNEILKLKTLRNIEETNAFNKSEAKTVSAKEKDVQVNTQYVQANIDYGKMKNNEDYFKNLYNLFENAHIYYRGFARDK